jgi:hypothetical protein
MTTGQNQENLQTYTASDLRIGLATSQAGTYVVPENATWTSNNNSSSSNGSIAYSPSTNYTSPGSPLYLAYGVDVPKTAVTGDWGNSATWTPSGVPTDNDRCIIPSGVTVTVQGGGTYTCRDLSLTTSGVLTNVSGNTLTVTGNVSNASGCTINVPSGSLMTVGTSCGDNQSFSNSGTLNLTGGKLIMNGQLTTGGAFNMSGGELVFDPNSGVASTSYSNSTGVFYISGGTSSVTGGTITFNDPVFTSSSNAPSIGYYQSAGSWATTIVMGGTIDNTGTSGGCTVNATTATNGFGIYTSNNFAVDSFVLNGGTSDPARFTGTVSGATGFYVKKDLTIPASHELRNVSSFGVGANLINHGTFTTIGTTKFETMNVGTVTAVSTAQTVSGSGLFRDATSSPASNFALLLFNNNSAGGITFPGDVSCIYGITHTAGIITMGTGTNTLTIGTNTSNQGSYTFTAGRVIGKITRWLSASTGSRDFPIGTSTTGRKITVNYTSTSGMTGGTLTAQFTAGTPGTTGLPLNAYGSINVENVSPTGYWTMTANTLTGGTYTVSVDATSFKDYANMDLTAANVRLVKRPTGGSWSATGITTVNAPSNMNAVSLTGVTNGFSEFGIGATDAVLDVEFTSIIAEKKATSNQITWTTANEKDIQHFAVERSIDNQNWAKLGTVVAGKGAYQYTDETPSLLSYYRVRSVEMSGKEQVSKVVAVQRGKGKLAILNTYPSPAKEGMSIEFEGTENGTAVLSLTDIAGKVVMTQNVKMTEGLNQLRLDLAHLSNGVYFLRLNDKTHSVVQRIVKQ